MQQDKLEKYIIDNKNDFDVYEPADELWDKIQKPSTPVRKINWMKVATRVAAVLAIFIASYFFHDLVPLKQDKNIGAIENPVDEVQNERMQVLMEAEVFYTSKINAAKEEIFVLSGNDKNMMEILNYDLEEMDQVFEELKNDLKDNGDNEEVIEAMIQNYRLKLEILEEMLLQMNRMSNDDKNDEGYEI